MPKPRILRTMTWLAPGGGVDEQVKLSILGLGDEFEFHLLTGREIQSQDFHNIPGLKIYICKWMVPNFNPIMDLFTLIWLKRFLKANRFDLVHTHETKSSFLTRLAFSKKLLTPLIYGIHGVVFNDPRSNLGNKIYEFLERSTIGKADQLIAVSEDVKSEYLIRNIGTGMPWEVIYSGVDVPKFVLSQPAENSIRLRISLGIADQDLVIVNIGRFSISKNQKDTIQAFKRICDQNPSINLLLILVGEGPEKSNCESLVETFGLANKVKFVGFQKSIEDYLAISEINVITSLREGLPRVVVESSLAGIPTVGYQVEGISEIVSDQKSGLIVPQGDLEALVLGINELVLDAEKRRKFGILAREIALRNWSHESMNNRLRILYRNLLQGRASEF
jgi:glycosyltransferase involved in cell wall biosynthesis